MMAKLRGMARKALQKMVSSLEGQEQKDEQLRLALLEWMDATVAYDRKRREQLLVEIAEERERQRTIADARTIRKKTHAVVELRRSRLVSQKPPRASTEPTTCVKPDGVKIRGNRKGCGASYRMVDGVEQHCHAPVVHIG